MGTRRNSREWAVQILFRLDMNPGELEPALKAFWADTEADDVSRRFTEEVVRGVRAEVAELDATIQKYAEHWDIHRMAVVDRNVLRMALYEMTHRADIPPVVSINEAVDIAKYFSSSEAGRFVNGILDRIRKDLPRPARTAES